MPNMKPLTHKVDCFKGRVALEVKWNNKDPFFDRDLEQFRLLFELRAIDVGVIVTWASELQQIFNRPPARASRTGIRPRTIPSCGRVSMAGAAADALS